MVSLVFPVAVPLLDTIVSLTNVQLARSAHDRSVVIFGGAAGELVTWVARGLRFIAALTACEELGGDG